MNTQAQALVSNPRQIISAGALYGLADVAVLAVGGFLLLPLYTRTLSQAEFGMFVIVKANVEIISCVLHLGLVSAVARVYFDHRRAGQQAAYINSVLLFFGLLTLLATGLFAAGGAQVWAWLSPGVPAQPFMWLALAISVLAFASTLGTTWLRLEDRVQAFTLVQLASAALLVLATTLALAVWHSGLPGLLLAMLSSSVLGALMLPRLLGGALHWRIHWPHVRDTLRYSLPIVAGLLAYFVLNRISTLILQRHVGLEDIAVFGLAQQLAMLVGIAGTAFAKAMQPAAFRAEAGQFPALMKRSTRSFLLLMTGVTSLVLLFATDIVTLLAPSHYQAGHDVLRLLLVASFIYSISLLSDTALLYHRRPKASAAVSVAGAALSVALGLVLIPRLGLLGAALTITLAFLGLTLIGHAVARRVSGLSYLLPFAAALACVCAVAGFEAWVQRQGWPELLALAVRWVAAGAVAGGLYTFQRRRPPALV